LIQASTIKTNPAFVLFDVLDANFGEKIDGGYAGRSETELSLLQSMVPAGEIEPTAQIEKT
jgi:hypothetical protein